MMAFSDVGVEILNHCILTYILIQWLSISTPTSDDVNVRNADWSAALEMTLQRSLWFGGSLWLRKAFVGERWQHAGGGRWVGVV